MLSGDLTGNDNYTTPGATLDENAYHVMEGANNVILEGVTIQGGNANGSFPNYRAGGLYNSSASPTIDHVVFKHNYADYGGAVYNSQSSPIFSNVVFYENHARLLGGGVDNNNSSTSTITNAIFANNTSGVFNTRSAGGIFNDGDGTALLRNVTFSNNFAISGGAQNSSGVYDGPASNPQPFINVLFWESQMTNRSANSVVNEATVGAVTDPFVDSANPAGADGIFGTADDGLRIAPTATAVINQGVTGATIPIVDILGNGRIGNPEPGAYEYRP